MREFDPASLGLASHATIALALSDAAATRRLGASLARRCADGGWIGLVGDLGAGKTTLVQGLVSELDESAEASSPTYTLLNEYHTDPPVWHFDLYRLESVDELETIAYWDYAEDDDAIVIVEWVDRIRAAWPGSGVLVWLRHDPDGGRRAELWVEEWDPDAIEQFRQEFAEHP
jgi:tRNA threonylcarbamoyl adenosine modification protein YjeE